MCLSGCVSNGEKSMERWLLYIASILKSPLSPVMALNKLHHIWREVKELKFNHIDVFIGFRFCLSSGPKIFGPNWCRMSGAVKSGESPGDMLRSLVMELMSVSGTPRDWRVSFGAPLYQLTPTWPR
jgi:hypothetical protein